MISSYLETQTLENILNSHRYTSDYKQDVFDCSNMCLLLDTFLESHGIHSYIAISQPLDIDNIRHCWLMVIYGNNIMPIEPTISPLERIGTIMDINDSRYSNYTLYEDLSNILERYETSHRQFWETNETIIKK